MPSVSRKVSLIVYDLDENSTLEVSESVWNSYQAALNRLLKATEHLDKNMGEGDESTSN